MRLCAADAATSVKPNIVYILADDMGYADAGFMGSMDLRTPNLDRRAGGSLEQPLPIDGKTVVKRKGKKGLKKDLQTR